MRQRQDSISAARWLAVRNTAASEAPAHGLLRITGVDGDGTIAVGQPDADGQGQVLVNGPVAIPAGRYGQAHNASPAAVLYDSGDGTPAAGETWGAASGSWKARKNKAGGYVLSAGDAASGLVNVNHAWGALGAAAAGSVTVKEVDGSPSVSSVTTLQFDSSDGFVVQEVSSGVARVDIAPASPTQTGVVDTVTQAFGGAKRFTNQSLKHSSDDGDGLTYTFYQGPKGASGHYAAELSSSTLGSGSGNPWGGSSWVARRLDNERWIGLELSPENKTVLLSSGGTASSYPIAFAVATSDIAYEVGLTGTYAYPASIRITGGIVTACTAGSGGSGTVTSINVSGGTTGLTFSGGPITTSGTITMAGALAVANGGTGATDAAGARSNLGLGALATLGSGTAYSVLARAGGTSGDRADLAPAGTTLPYVLAYVPGTGLTWAEFVQDVSFHGLMYWDYRFGAFQAITTEEAQSNAAGGSLFRWSSDGDAGWVDLPVPVGSGGTGATTAAAARSALGLAIGTNVQAWDADLDALAALTGTNTIYYRSASNTWSAVTVGSNLTFSGGTLSASSPAVSDGDKGDITVSSSGTVWTIDTGAVGLSKLANLSSNVVIGRNSVVSGAPGEVTLTQLLDWIGSAAQGDLLYRGASAWARLAAGTANRVLVTGGAGANPAWADLVASQIPSVTQVSQSQTATAASTSSTSYADLDSVTLTVTSGSKVVILWRADVYGTSVGASSVQFRVRRGASTLGLDPAADFAFGAPSEVTGASLVYYDLHGTSGSVTYTVQYKAGAGTIAVRNRNLVIVELIK